MKQYFLLSAAAISYWMDLLHRFSPWIQTFFGPRDTTAMHSEATFPELQTGRSKDITGPLSFTAHCDNSHRLLPGLLFCCTASITNLARIKLAQENPTFAEPSFMLFALQNDLCQPHTNTATSAFQTGSRNKQDRRGALVKSEIGSKSLVNKDCTVDGEVIWLA